MTTIVLDHRTKRYGAVTAVDDLSFTLEPGTVTGFVGAKGAGKSTTLRMLLGLTHPTSGTVTIDTLGSTFDTLLGVSTGSSVSALTQIAANDDNPAGAARLVEASLVDALTELRALSGQELLEQRYQRFRVLGSFQE